MIKIRNIILSFILMLGSLSYAEEGVPGMTCEEQYTSDSPLLVTDATDMGKREYENFRETLIPKGDNVSHFITKKSIVRMIRKPVRGEDYVNVEVLGEAKYNKPRSKGYFSEYAYTKAVPQAMRGQKGFIHKDSLLPSDDFVFVVSKDTTFVALPSPYDEAKAFRIAKSGNKYKVNHCCSEVDQAQCFDFPQFEVKLEGGWSEISDDSINSRVYCGVSTDTRPIEKNQYEAVLNILAHPGLGLSAGLLEGNRTRANANDLYYVDSRGLIMLPHLPAEKGVTLTEGPYGSYHFTGGGQDIQGDDAYLAPYAACGFMAVMREWNRRYPDCSGKGCGITWGNCSHSTHIAGVKGRWPSKTHGHGHCIDIRLFTTTSSTVSSSVYSKYYNRNRVVEFLQLARAAGASTIYLEDSKAARQVHKQSGSGYPSVLTRVPPHKDHMHVCFSHRNTDSRSSFADPNLPATNRRLKNLCEQDAKDALAGAPSKLLGTDVVATAGNKTPTTILPERVPIPKPRPEGLAERFQEQQEAEQTAQAPVLPIPEDKPVIADTPAIEDTRPKSRPEELVTIDETRPVARPEDLVPGPVEVTTLTPPEVVTGDQPQPEPAIIEPQSESTLNPDAVTETAPATLEELTIESTPDVALDPRITAEPVKDETITVSEILPPPEKPLEQQAEQEVMPQPENDPFEEKPGEVSVNDIIHEEISQDQLVAEEKEKYFGEDLSEVEQSDNTPIVEGDVVKPQEQEDSNDGVQGIRLQNATESSASAPEQFSDDGPSDSSLGYLPSSGPSRRYRNGARRPAERDAGDDVSDAVSGAYEPVATPEETSGFGFMSFFTGIFEAIANLFRSLFGG